MRLLLSNIANNSFLKTEKDKKSSCKFKFNMSKVKIEFKEDFCMRIKYSEGPFAHLNL
jgi:hypothetical protein